MRAAARHTVRAVVRASMQLDVVRGGVRGLALKGWVPRTVWNRLPIVEDAFAVTLPGGASFRYLARPGDAIGHAFYWRGIDAWEADTIRVFLTLARRARRFLDVGANTGAYSLLACAVNPEVRVAAYEPVPRVRERLIANLGCNGFLDRCTVRPVAVADQRGVTQLHVPHAIMPSSASLARAGFRDLAGELIDVEVTTADEDAAGPVDLVKIDVEGFEDRVLRGMARILETDRPVIICECNPDGPYEAVDAWLAERGYVFFHLREHGPVPRARIEPDPEERHRNYACVPAEDQAAARALAGARARP